MRLPFIEIAPQSDVSVREGEDGFGLRQSVEVKFRLADAPLFDSEGGMFDHGRFLRSAFIVVIVVLSRALSF
jgi:hypothetical protein